MYEPRTAPLLPPEKFILRVVAHLLGVVAFVGVSLLGGMIGYHRLAGMEWIDAFLNASMLLGGMGPVGDLPNNTAKFFAGVYALYSGLVFIISAGIVIAPIAHRIFHGLHIDAD